MSAASQASATPSTANARPARGKSKLATVALAFLLGSLGAHRFYLAGVRDRYGWMHLLATLAGTIGVASLLADAGNPVLNWVFAVLGGTSLTSAFGCDRLRPAAGRKWDARFNPHGAPTRSGWPVVILVILSLLIGTGLLMAGRPSVSRPTSNRR